jgi:WD40 repeat protein
MNFYDAFISYGRADSKAFAINLNEKLTAAGLNVWFDQDDIPLAVDYQKQIDDGIEKAHNFLFIIAPHSVNSPYCLKEIELAIKLNKRIIPLLQVEQISHEIWQQRNPNKTEEDWQEYQQKGLHSSYGNKHPAISKINWIRFADNLDDFSTYFDGLLNAINKQQDYVEQHTNFLVQALEWSRNQQQTNYFLVGEERGKAEQWLKQRFIEEQPPCLPTDLHCEFICESIKNSQNLLSQLFLAAADTDEAIKEKIRKTLMRESITVWTNKADIKTGTAFPEAINQGIEGADNFVYLISLDSLKSAYCQQELNQALANNKRIIPLLVAETDLELIPSELKKLQFIDFTQSESAEKYRFSADKLLQELKKEPSYYEKHKILLVKARKWQKQNQNSSLLLRGYNLQHFEAWLKVAKQREDYPPLPLQEEFITASLNKPEESSLEVFISYSRTDSDLARKINDALQELGKTTWFDQESIATGTDFQQEINRGIASSDNFLFIISPKSVNSPYCAGEVEYAKNLGKRFITILHRPLSNDDKQKLPAALANVQWLDFNQHGGEFFANFNELVRTLDTDRDHVRSHTKWSQRALEWDEKGKNVDLLLRGSEFAVAEAWLKTAETENKKPARTDLQKELIHKSREAIAAQRKQNQRQLLVLRSLLTGAIVLLVAAIGTTGFAFLQKQEAEAQKLNAEKARTQAQRSEKEAKNQAEFARQKKVEAEKARTQAQISEKEAKSQAESAKKQKQNAVIASDKAQKSEKKAKEQLSLTESQRKQTIIALISASQELFDSNKEFDALLASINAGKQVKQVAFRVNPDIQVRIKDALLNPIFWIQERNRLEGHKGTVNSVSFSPDGRVLASDSADGTIKLWNSTTGKIINTLDKNKIGINSFSFIKDGLLTSDSTDGTIKLWNVTTGKVINTIKADKLGKSNVIFSPDGRIASLSPDHTLKFWNVTTGKIINTLKADKLGKSDLIFSPDGQWLVSIIGRWDSSKNGADSTIWNVTTGKVINTFKVTSNGYIDSIIFSPNGKMLASAGEDRTIHLWDVVTGKEIKTLTGHTNRIRSISFSLNGQILASSGWDKTIKLWDVTTGKEIKTIMGQAEQSSISFGPKNLLASASSDGTIKFWDINPHKEVIPLDSYPGDGISFSPDGKLLASTAGQTNTIKLWDVPNHKEIATLTGHRHWIKSLNFSPNGQWLASAAWDYTIKLWNVRDCIKTTTCEASETLKLDSQFIHNVSFSPDGTLLASAGNKGWGTNNNIQLWDVATRPINTKPIKILQGHRDFINSISFSPNGKLLASGSNDKTIKIWDVANAKEIKTLTGHSDGVQWVNFSRDGKLLASTSNDQSIKLWNVTTGKEIKTLTGHTNSVTSVIFGSNGQWLVSGSQDKTIKLWDVPTGKEINTFKGYGDGIKNLSLSHDEQLLASQGNKLILWNVKILSNLTLDNLMVRGCDWVRSYLENNPNLNDSDKDLCDSIGT